jgi:6-phosphogluconolactonase
MLEIKYDKNIAGLQNIFAFSTLDLISKNQAAGKKTAIGLSGGKTPASFYRRLGELSNSEPFAGINWKAVSFFMDDERHVPLDSNESNYKNAADSLCLDSKIPREIIHPLNFDLFTPSLIAAGYESEIIKKTGGSGVFDLLILGMGSDGHIASLFERTVYETRADNFNGPGSKDSCDFKNGRLSGRIFISHFVTKLSSIRYSLTLNAILSARRVIMLVTGDEKKEILKTAIQAENKTEQIPASALFKAGASHAEFILTLITDIQPL